MKPTGSNAVFHVTDIENSIDFYSTKLGFQVDFKYGNPASYAGLSNGNVCLHISSGYPYKNNTGHGNLYLFYPEVDNLYNKLVKEGVNFYCHIGDRDYGLRDFAIKDPDDNQIGIGAELSKNA